MKQQQTLIECGTVIAAQAEQALVKVNILGRDTDWLPILQQANAFKRHYVPPRVGQQVVVLIGRYVLGSIYNQSCSEPQASATQEVSVYEDGTHIAYDSATHTLTLHSLDVLNITTNQAVNITTQTAKVTADQLTLAANELQINSASGDITVNGISLVNHTHPQNAGNHYGGGTNTGSAQ